MLQLLDLAGIYFRSFHALPSSMTAPDGRPVNAIRGTIDIIRRVMIDAKPTRVIACLDLDWRPAWRVELLPSYKAHRVIEEGGGATGTGVPGGADVEEVPDELSPQVPLLLEVLEAFGIAIAGAEGFEADDVIGTLAARETVDPVEVVTGDRDLLQLARETPTPVRVRYVGAGMSKVQVLDQAGVAEKYGIPASRYADFAALRGDPSDGLPGVAGIGEKTAAQLVGTFGTIEDIVVAANDRNSGMPQASRKKLLAAADYLAVAPKVVRVAEDAPVSVHPAGDGALPSSPTDPARLAALVKELGIGQSVKRLLDTMLTR
ncbi:flap endonuclease [Nakamurella sp. YIM 132087]|uniref:5'-3' exonuclease n=1 Tax=Nakamurella alba TaxID=2665158 RepID=A0A7K1FRN5_9ACTN|nr:5'-3' exonuclease [Nakamurella alba]MTD16808.1 flap endonuclease [Nakamurella alba]